MILTIAVVLLFVLVIGLFAVGGFAISHWSETRRRLDTELTDTAATTDADDDDDGGDDVDTDLEPPEVATGFLGILKQWRHNRRAAKLAKKGYVRWYLVGSSWSRPRWVKPEVHGQGEPRIREDGSVYYFPESAMLPDQRTGAWTAVHVTNEPQPLNLRDPAMPAMDGDRVEAVLQLEAESEAPGWLSNIDTSMLMWVGIGGILLLAVGSQVLGIGG